jgi:hypothetical protein
MAISLDSNWDAGGHGLSRAGTWRLAAVLAVWLALVAWLGMKGVFQASPTNPPLGALIAIVAPLAAFAVAYLVSKRFSDFVLAIDLRLLTAFQAWRVLGGMFLVLYAYAMLSPVFAFPAGLGDFAVGAAAPFVLWAMMRRSPGWERRVFWLTIAGLADFAGAIATGVLTSPSTLGVFADPAARANMGEMPLSLIPTFAVPLWTIFHIITLLQLRRLAAARS